MNQADPQELGVQIIVPHLPIYISTPFKGATNQGGYSTQLTTFKLFSNYFIDA